MMRRNVRCVGIVDEETKEAMIKNGSKCAFEEIGEGLKAEIKFYYALIEVN